MPLPAPAPREPIHTREIVCRGYRRSDGLWDIEGHLTDVKTYTFTNQHRGEVKPGTPVHDMWIRMTVDDALIIRGFEAASDATPFRPCPDIIPNFQRLVGLSIRTGFTAKVRELLGGKEGCTHLVELLGPVATTAFQTIYPWRERQARLEGRSTLDNGKVPPMLDSCHALARDSEVVKQHWPAFYTGT